MTDLPESLFANPVWHALQTRHRHLAVSMGDAARYPADVVPFAAVNTPSASAFRQLRELLAGDESVWLVGEGHPQFQGLSVVETLPCLQMVLPKEITPPCPTVEMVPLSAANAHEMVELTTVAFPGFFRIRTCEMGNYFGIRMEGKLIAMGGERLALPSFTEISAVCTHPEYRGRGFAESLIWQVVRRHRREGLTSCLHVGSSNQRAIQLYLRLGFKIVRTVTLNRILRSS